MSFEEFVESVAGAAPPPVSKALQALWFDRKGDWDRAHDAAQEETGASGAWVHAYLHRKEGDPGNAEYWYARASKPGSSQSLDKEWEAIARDLLAR